MASSQLAAGPVVASVLSPRRFVRVFVFPTDMAGPQCLQARDRALTSSLAPSASACCA